MGLSSNSLIHFTETKDSLVGILKNNFKVSYCLENIITPSGNLHYAIPMVSFCDIPLSEVKEHINKYGSYGIGLDKKWGQSKGLNPVLYADRNSSLANNYYVAFKTLFLGKNKKVTEVDDTEAQLIDIMRYMKNYEADLTRKGKTIPDYRFADEKEWRYVPDKSQAQIIVKGNTFSSVMKSALNEHINELRLEFKPSDIKYIIINNESEISELIDVVRRAKGKNFTLDDVERLMTRIITTEQIRTDF